MFLKHRCYIAFLILFIVSQCHSKSYFRQNNAKGNKIGNINYRRGLSDSDEPHQPLTSMQEHCWMRLNSKHHFQIMDKLDETYKDIRKELQDAVENDHFDDEMINAMIKKGGAAEREIHKASRDSGLIPAGINLGGYCMMRMPNSLLFFHRMKLRNDTHFRVTQLHTDLSSMVLSARISLNDLHLTGSYDRTVTDKDPSILFYTPTYGQLEFLLKNVQYKMEGRYRLLNDRLTIELIISELSLDDVMMTYLNNPANKPIQLQKENIDDFLDRLKNDLDKWLKDYFNDYLMYFGLMGNTEVNSKFQQYDKEKALELNDFTDHAISLLSHRLHETNTGSVKLPKFTIFTSNGMEFVLRNGVLRGLDSMYRRSVATGRKDGSIRKVDAVVGFSNLKATYKYDAILSKNVPALTGLLILTADELTARLGMAFVTDPESMDLQFEFLEQAKPESLTVEGAANRLISNFKYLLEQHVISIMSNTLIHNIKLLSTLTRCTPILPAYRDVNFINSEDEGRISDTYSDLAPFTATPPDFLIEKTTLKDIINQQSDNQKDGQSDDTTKEKVQDDNIENSDTDDNNPEMDVIKPFTATPPDFLIEKTTLKDIIDQHSDNQKHVETGQSDDNTKEIVQEDNIKNSDTDDNNSEMEVIKPFTATPPDYLIEKTTLKDIIDQQSNSQKDFLIPDIKKMKPDFVVIKDDSAELEIPSDETEHKRNVHVKYLKNLTITQNNPK